MTCSPPSLSKWLSSLYVVAAGSLVPSHWKTLFEFGQGSIFGPEFENHFPKIIFLPIFKRDSGDRLAHHGFSWASHRIQVERRSMLRLHAKGLPSAFRAICSSSKCTFSKHTACIEAFTPAAGSCSRKTRPQSRKLSICCSSSSAKTTDIAVCGMLEIQRIKCLSDNYAWLFTSGGRTAVVDPSESGRILDLDALLGEGSYLLH